MTELPGQAQGMTPAAAAEAAQREIAELRTVLEVTPLSEVVRDAPVLLPVIAGVAQGLGRVPAAGRAASDGQAPSSDLNRAATQLNDVAQQAPRPRLSGRALRRATARLRPGERGNGVLDQALRAQEAANRPEIRGGTDPAAIAAVRPGLVQSCIDLAGCTRVAERALGAYNDPRADDLQAARRSFAEAGAGLVSRTEDRSRRGRGAVTPQRDVYREAGFGPGPGKFGPYVSAYVNAAFSRRPVTFWGFNRRENEERAVGISPGPDKHRPTGTRRARPDRGRGSEP